MNKLLFICIVIAANLYFKPAHCQPVAIGPIEITPKSSSVAIEASRLVNHPYVMFFPTLKLAIKNKSSSDVKLILISNSIDIYDNLDQKLTRDPRSLTSSGINLSKSNSNTQRIFIDDKDKFVSIRPGEEIQSYIGIKDRHAIRVDDPSGDIYKTHRSSTITINGAFGIINIDGSTDIKNFSLSNINVTTLMR